ncbi:MAG: 50S ribosomal protein L29 [Candidatus Omnitrophica bacterium]|nr:50S ribosomal protein L29 [Candidatus Omnitrophota bacterium]MCK4422802.1 50S ribosomal protein L29 [Candidatus Omnitrophota bacterium]
MTSEELEQRKSSLAAELLKLRTQQKISRVEDPTQIKLMRRDIARILTVIGEKSHA